MARVLLIRHGETVATVASRYSGQREEPLTERGAAQHERLLARLGQTAIDRVVSSDLERCRLFAEALARERDARLELTPALREASFGAWEGLTYDEARAADRAAMTAFNRDPAHVAPPGGESLEAAGARAFAYWKELLRGFGRREATLVVVGHGGTLVALLCLLLAIPLERYWTLRLDNAGLTVLDTYPSGPIVSVLNDTCHLADLAP